MDVNALITKVTEMCHIFLMNSGKTQDNNREMPEKYQAQYIQLLIPLKYHFFLSIYTKLCNELTGLYAFSSTFLFF